MKNTVKMAVMAALLSGFIFSAGSLAVAGADLAPASRAGQGTGAALSLGSASPAW